MDSGTILFRLSFAAAVVGLVAISLFMARQRASRPGDPGDRGQV